MSGSLRPHGLQYSPCPSLSPRVCSDSCLLRQSCHPTISSSVIPFSSCLQSIPASIRVFSNEVALCIRWPKYWNFSFSISPSSEYSGLISFRENFLHMWTQLIENHFLIASSLCLIYYTISLLYMLLSACRFREMHKLPSLTPLLNRDKLTRLCF